MSIRIAPSLLSADFARLGEEARAVQEAGAAHQHARVPIDVHLMVKPVDSLICAFAEAGANWISFHPEASEHIDRSLALVRDNGARAGLALNPASSLAWLDHVLDRLDFVLLMSVNPGFGGQSFIESALPKTRACRALLDRFEAETGRHIDLEIDGGVKPDNVAAIAEAGAEVLVAGSAVFSQDDYAAAIAAIHAGAEAGAGRRSGAER